jgi:hypothetical protein
VHHAAFDCAHQAMQPCRRATIAELRARVVGLIAAVEKAAGRRGYARPEAAEAAALAGFTAGGDLPAAEVAFLGYRFLLAAPFDADTARRHGFAAAAAVGHVLAQARVRDHRALCDSWISWADRRLTVIASEWKAATAGQQ